MGEPADERSTARPGGTIVVRYWAAARAAAGVEADEVGVRGETTLAQLLDIVRARHVDSPRLGAVIAVCSVLVGDRPVGTTDAREVVVRPGETVELLPPFAGG